MSNDQKIKVSINYTCPRTLVATYHVEGVDLEIRGDELFFRCRCGDTHQIKTKPT